MLFTVFSAWGVLMCGAVVGQGEAAEKPAPVLETQDKSRVLWKYAPEGSRFEEVVVGDGTVFALDRSGKVHALQAKSGRPRWSKAGGLPFRYGFGLALSENPAFEALFVGCDSGLLALDRKTGKTIWHTKLALGVAGPACTDKAVFAGSSDGNLYACDLSTGKILWKHDFLKDAPEDPPGFLGKSARFAGRPARPREAATDGKMVVFSVFDQCRMLAVDVEKGRRLWEFQTKGWVHGRPAIGPRDVVLGSQDQHFYAVDKETGKLTWKVKTGARNEAAAAATSRFVYVGSCDANLYAIDQGRVGWKFATEHEKGRGAPIYSCPLVLGEKVYLAAMRGKIYAIESKSGKLLWSERPLPDAEMSSELVAEAGRLFVTTRKGRKAGESAVLALKIE